MRKSILIAAAMLAACIAWPTFAEESKPHKPDHGPALQRKLVPVEIKLVDSAGKPLNLDGLALGSGARARVTQISGEYSWPVVAQLDGERSLVYGGSPGFPGLEPGEYELEAALGHYGPLRHRLRVEEEPVSLELRAPNARKVVKVRYVDDAGNALAMVPRSPFYEATPATLPHRETFLPEPVLRLPANRHLGGGGFGHRRARGGAGHDRFVFTLTDDGHIYATVFEGGDGKLIVPLSEEWFGKARGEFDLPLKDDTVEVRVQLTDDWHNLDQSELKFRNQDDPGWKKMMAAPTADPTPWNAAHVMRLRLSPTVAAWARFGGARAREGKSLEARLSPAGMEMAEVPETIGGFSFTSRDDGLRVGGPVTIEGYTRRTRELRSGPAQIGLNADAVGRAEGTFLRVVNSSGTPLRFVECTAIPLPDDATAAAMRELEIELREKGTRPSAPDLLNTRQQIALREAAENNDEAAIEEAIGAGAFKALQKREFRLRYARFGAWYDSHRRMDGDESGYVIAPHVRLEKDNLYALYIWGDSRDDLKPDLRIVVRGEGDVTDLGVIRLP
jgi:hypothetical protein